MVLGGAVVAILVGTLFPAPVSAGVGTLGKMTDFTKSADSGETAFNVLFALLVAGPAVVAAAVLWGAAEVASASRRGSGRSRHDRTGLEVGDEV
jgi:hypothetical protein